MIGPDDPSKRDLLECLIHRDLGLDSITGDGGQPDDDRVHVEEKLATVNPNPYDRPTTDHDFGEKEQEYGVE